MHHISFNHVDVPVISSGALGEVQYAYCNCLSKDFSPPRLSSGERTHISFQNETM